MAKLQRSNEEIIDAYMVHMKWKRLSTNTTAIRLSYLNKLSRELGKFSEIKSKDLQAWLSMRDLEANTQSLYLTTYHGLYEFAIKAKYLKKDPTLAIDKPKGTHGQPHPISDEDLAKAFAGADSLMACWLSLGAFAGCRCQEIALMCRQDIFDDVSMRLFIANGKGNKTRWVPLNAKLLSALTHRGMPDIGRMWDITPQQMSRALNDYLHDEVGTESTAHSLRHWYATKMYQKTHDLRKVQLLLGHSSPATTAIYAAADMSDVASDVESLSYGEAA